LFALFLFIGGLSLSAQEKNLTYYARHEQEILPDAQDAFDRGQYERAVTIYGWYYVIVGKSVDELRNKAERCARLSSDLTSLIMAGDTEAAYEKAQALLEINPNDPVAKELVEGYEAPAEPTPEEPVVETPEEQPVQEDTIAVYYPPVQEVIPDEVVPEVQPEPVVPEEEVVAEDAPIWTGPLRKPLTIRTRFVVKVGAALLDMKQVAPGGSLGVYNFGGSHIGVEFGGYVCNSLSSASMFGADASLVLRAGNKVYPKVGAGFFTCKSDGGATKGLCGNFGLTFIIGRGFCLEAGVKYYPKVMVTGLDLVSTAGQSYSFPSAKEALAGGIAPMFSIGLAF